MAAHPLLFTPAKLNGCLDAALSTFRLHVESRIASLLGCGFYTIGPCGEEQLACIGNVLRPEDPAALHYRHIAVTIARHLQMGIPLEKILLDRARAFVVSSLDPVTGGGHCAIGGSPSDFLVTSTLASQACPALGRALGVSLATAIKAPCKFPSDSVSFVSVGDGSVNNAHFLSAVNIAEYAAFRGFRTPLVFCVTDNGVCISLRGYNYFQNIFSKKLQMPFFNANGKDFVDVWIKSSQALEYSRSQKKPCTLGIRGLTRRFGHAATDRQTAYLKKEEIDAWAATNPLLDLIQQLVHAGVYTPQQVHQRFLDIESRVQSAFEAAHQEPKLTDRKAVVARVSAPIVPVPDGVNLRFPISASSHHAPAAGATTKTSKSAAPLVQPGTYGTSGSAAQVMRKHMNNVFDEALGKYKECVYIGEDVTHGGYYIVTENLANKYPVKVADFPPDETALVGIGMGYSQVGLLPIVEIPYAKYLDCGYDMFAEAGLMHWLSNGKQPNGMIIRLQGFGRGVFGGNFHTHNMIPLLPGMDVVSYSNGPDYARAMRYALHQAKKGRVIVFVDCTEILNVRQIPKSGHSWEFAYTGENDWASFDGVTVYHADAAHRKAAATAVVTYGGGVFAALEAQAMAAASSGGKKSTTDETPSFDVIDCPLLSAVPDGLRAALSRYDRIVFADICKRGASPLAAHFTTLFNEGAFNRELPKLAAKAPAVVGKLVARVEVIGAEPTYNSLGNTITFTNAEDILDAVKRVAE